MRLHEERASKGDEATWNAGLGAGCLLSNYPTNRSLQDAMYYSAVYDGEGDVGLHDLGGFHGEQVAFEDRDVGQHAGEEATLHSILPFYPGGTSGVGIQR